MLYELQTFCIITSEFWELAEQCLETIPVPSLEVNSNGKGGEEQSIVLMEGDGEF